jgi:hypothetical protein
MNRAKSGGLYAQVNESEVKIFHHQTFWGLQLLKVNPRNATDYMHMTLVRRNHTVILRN